MGTITKRLTDAERGELIEAENAIVRARADLGALAAQEIELAARMRGAYDELVKVANARATSHAIIRRVYGVAPTVEIGIDLVTGTISLPAPDVADTEPPPAAAANDPAVN